MLLRILTIIVLLTITSSAFGIYANQRVQFVTEDLPPLQIDGGKQPPTGALIELVKLIIADSGIDAKISIYPWARSYEQATKKPNTFIFSMLRSDEREEKFIWIGKLFTIKSYFAALKANSNIQVSSIEQAKQYVVGAIRHDLAENYLLNKGFTHKKNLYVSNKYPALWSQLYTGKTDLVFTNSIIWRHEILGASFDPAKVALVYEINDFASDLYLAAHLATDKTVINKVKASFDAIKADGRYHQIMTKWQLNSPQS
ncbi:MULTISPECIES: ABC transporter substrate-binding protein [Thalassotalea]|uniref:ABC transporter substrate-binding protein n=1 Tax=Thalassotalea castellviae TaxID=3075612 RepID=A0ABU3A4Z5_9GAMM|nr:ABC transporter substrate-binding protein [Thalassotalea sp. W431]MDT0605024.1 ABC transporter substrate-binding protein [Thalassotalea sp. W431]